MSWAGDKGEGLALWVGFSLGIFYVFFGIFMVFRSANARVSQLVDSRQGGQSVGEPTERPVSQSVGQRAAVSQSVSQSVSQPSRQSVGLLIWRYTCKPVSMEYRNRQMRGRV